MVYNVVKRSVNLESGIKLDRLGILFAQNDESAHSFEISVYNGDEETDLTGYSIYAYFIRGDDVTVTINGTASGNKAIVVLPTICYKEIGKFHFVIKAVSMDITSAIYWADGTISRTESDILSDPDNVVPSLSDLLAQIQNANDAAQAANEAAQTASDAAESANTAAGNADASASSADTAAENANNAAQNANESASAADKAASAASTAAKLVSDNYVPEFTVGTVETVSAENADVTIDSTDLQNPVISFKIPDGRGALYVEPSEEEYEEDTISASEMKGATDSSDGTSGSVPAPTSANADYDHFLKGDGTWSALPLYDGTNAGMVNPSAKSDLSRTSYNFLNKSGYWQSLNFGYQSNSFSDITGKYDHCYYIAVDKSTRLYSNQSKLLVYVESDIRVTTTGTGTGYIDLTVVDYDDSAVASGSAYSYDDDSYAILRDSFLMKADETRLKRFSSFSLCNFKSTSTKSGYIKVAYSSYDLNFIVSGKIVVLEIPNMLTKL